jgi:hypothetical protein
MPGGSWGQAGDRHSVHGLERRLEVEKVGRSERGRHKAGGLRFKVEKNSGRFMAQGKIKFFEV